MNRPLANAKKKHKGEAMADYRKIYIMNIEKLQNESLFRIAYNLLEEERQKKVDACKLPIDKCRSIGVWLLLRFALRQYLKEGDKTEQEIRSIFLEKLELTYGERGKPYFKHFSNVFFNLSHSGNFTACIISEHEVGIDLQKVSLYNEKAAKRLFTVERQMELLGCMNKKKRDMLFTCFFTQIEAIGKLSGQGLLEKSKSKEELENFYLDSYYIEEEYALTTAEHIYK